MTLGHKAAEGCNIRYEGDKRGPQSGSFYFTKGHKVATWTTRVRRGGSVSVGTNEMKVKILCSAFEEKVI